MNVLIWFKHDLRLSDHPALCHAAEMGAVLPLYIADPEEWQQPERSTRQWAFTAECLAGLREGLARLGAPLVVRTGEPQEIMARLCARHGIERILGHAGARSGWEERREIRLRQWAVTAGVEWMELSEAIDQSLKEPAALQAVPAVEPGQIPMARALKLAEDRCPHRQLGGRDEGLRLLDSFLQVRAANYAHMTTSPVVAERASSRLSPHLARGVISTAEVRAATMARQTEQTIGSLRAPLARFQTCLNQRDGLVFSPEFSNAGLPQYPATAIHAWTAAETGIPFLDACLRYLAATGWLNAGLRQMVAKCAITLLRLDPQQASPILARQFTDHDARIHTAQMRVIGAATHVPNPVKLGAKLDPGGSFTRRWLPELAAVPDPWLQAPWRWTGASGILGRRYPEPVVDLATAEREARAAMPVPRAKLRVRSENFEIIEQGRTMQRQSSVGQLSLDL